MKMNNPIEGVMKRIRTLNIPQASAWFSAEEWLPLWNEAGGMIICPINQSTSEHPLNVQSPDQQR